MKICIVLGTRPEIVKMAPIVRECQIRHGDYFMIHTGQHYSYDMDRVFFHDLELPDPNYNLNVGSGSHGKQTGLILQGIEPVLLQERPDVVLVQGDTNTVLAGALAAAKLNITIGHVEAGLRSFDRRMPEEINRIMADHISDLLFPPTEGSKINLMNEGVPEEKIFVTGNTVVDAVRQNLEISSRRSSILRTLGLETGTYILATLHRAENVDSPERLRSLMEGLRSTANESDLPIILPMHPRTKKNLQNYQIDVPDRVRVIEPFGYLDFLQLESHARLLMTDSGGIQEEGCILGVPCVTLRDSTERPETVDVGANILAGLDPQEIVKAARTMLKKQGGWGCPLGDGNAAAKIMDVLEKHHPRSVRSH